MAAWECSSIASGCGQPFSTASRRRWSEPTPGLPPPGEHELRSAAHADELVVEEIGRHLDEGEATPLLADHLVAGRIGDEMGEPLHRHGIAVPDAVLHRLGKGQETRHWSNGPLLGWSGVIYGPHLAGSNAIRSPPSCPALCRASTSCYLQ